MTGDGDEGAKDRGRYLDKVGAIQGASGGRNQTDEIIYQQEARDGSKVGGPSDNI